MKEKTDHDQIFKTLFKEFFREFLEGFLPEIAEEIDFSCVEFLEQELFTELNRGKRKLLDLVAKVRLISGEYEYILLHTEFESSKPDKKKFPERMFKYFCQLFLKFGKPVIPIVVFSDDKVWRTPVPNTFTMQFKDTQYLRFFFHSIKLKHYNWRKFIDSKNPLIYALMAKMDYNKNDIVRLKADFLRLVLNAEKNIARRSLLIEFIETYIILNKGQEKQFEEIISQPKLKEVRKMVTVYEKRGIQKGELKTAREVLLDVLELKFRKIPYSIKQKIKRCNNLQRLKQAHREAVLIDRIEDFKF
jgi:hypothetical protein